MWSDLLFALLFMVGWFLLTTKVLPRLGFHT